MKENMKTLIRIYGWEPLKNLINVRACFYFAVRVSEQFIREL